MPSTCRNSINFNEPGRIAFANFVSHANGWNAANATMIGVVNNDNRPRAGAELTDIARRLGLRSYRMVRLRKNIDFSPSKEPASVAVLCLFKALGGGIELRYQMDKGVRWVEGRGEARAGQYRALRRDMLLWVDKDAGWQEVSGANCDLSLVRV